MPQLRLLSHKTRESEDAIFAPPCSQGVDLRQQMVACAPYGGPIAMTRDQRKLLLLGSASTVPYITIYSSAGSLMSSFKFDRGGGKLVALGWSEEEKLVCVVEDGSVHQVGRL